MFSERSGAGESLRASIRNAQVGENQPDGGKWEVKPSRYQPNGRHMPTKTPLYLNISKQNHKDVNMRVSLRQKSTNRRACKSTLYCISMQLTLDYGGRTKGMPKAPKAQTPHHCTGQRPCEQFSHSTQRVQGSPFTNRRQPAGKPQIPESTRR